MSEEIKGKCYQEHEPTPNNPCEIKTILCNDIEIPVEFLKQNFVTVDGKKYIELQQENKQLKSIVEERELEIITLILELLRIAKQDYYWITNDKFEEAKKKIIHFVVTGDNDKKYFIEELDKAKVGDSNE